MTFTGRNLQFMLRVRMRHTNVKRRKAVNNKLTEDSIRLPSRHNTLVYDNDLIHRVGVGPLVTVYHVRIVERLSLLSVV